MEVGLGISCGKVAVCGFSPLVERLVAAGWVWCVLCLGFPYAVHGCGPFWFCMGWVEVQLVEVGLGISCGKVAVCGISPLMERLVAAGWVWCVCVCVCV